MRRALLAVSALAVAAAAQAAPAPAAPNPECPLDAPPDFACVITIDDDFVDEETCGFPLHIRATGKVLYMPRFRDGELIGESFVPNIKITVTNEENGRLVTDRDVGLDKATFLPDGSVFVLSTGLHFKVRTSDHRTIFRRIGLQIIRVSPEGEETVEVVGGNFDPEEDFPGVACDFLAGP